MKVSAFVRVVVPTVAITMLPLVVGIVSAWRVHSSQKQVSKSLALDVVGMRAGEELAIGIRDVRTQLNRFQTTGDRHCLDGIPAIRKEMDRWLLEAERVAGTDQKRALVGNLKTGYENFFRELDRAARQPAATLDVVERMRELNNDSLSRGVLAPAQQYLDLSEEDIARTNEANERMADKVVLGLLLLGTCGTISGLAGGFGIARGISRSIVRLSVPIRDVAGKLNEVVGPITFSSGADLEEMEKTLRKMADQIGAVVERLQESRREILRAEQLAAVGQMAAGIAHELRNPLMAMKILIQAAAERRPAAILEGRDLKVLEEEIGRSERSIQSFLDFARPPQLEKRTFALNALLDQVVELVSVRAKRQSVEIRCEPGTAEPIMIRADMGQIRQVFLNLLLNALDSVPSGGNIWVWSSIPPGTAERLVIDVADTGPGLPVHLGTRIFEPFVSTKTTGMGLGLSICKRIVEDHGGMILATNRPEGGALFTVSLPLSSPSNGQQGSAA